LASEDVNQVNEIDIQIIDSLQQITEEVIDVGYTR